MKENLKGVVERITFHNPDNGWSVLRVVPFNNPQQQETVIVHQTKVFAGATMEFEGTWIMHPKYGRQFKATLAQERKPASTAALEKYLGSGLIKGVGPQTAKKIVKYFDKETLTVFESSIERLTEIRGIARKKLEMISQAWQEHKSIRDVMMFLQSHGISTLFAVRIYKEYGDNAIQYVTQDPYRLSNDFYGIGFFSADKVALSIGFAPDSQKRIIAAIRHVLAASRNFGHCYLTLPQIQDEVIELLLPQESQTPSQYDFDDLSNISDNIADFNASYQENLKNRIPDILNQMKEDRLLMVRHIASNKKEEEQETCYYSKSLYFDELYVAKRVAKMCKESNQIKEDNKEPLPAAYPEHEQIERWVNLYCKARHIKLSHEQAKAVISIANQKFSILTGGPGCGKTTTTLVIVKLLEAIGDYRAKYSFLGSQEDVAASDKNQTDNHYNHQIKIVLAAPTGRAAQRMSEVIGKEAKTIHRLLEWKGGEFKKNEETPLKADFLIVDECSMLDISLTAALLRAVPESCQVLFIGDADQLPSVGAGNVLKDMIASGVVPCFVLTQIFRQAQESLIIKYAHQINKGEVPWIASPFKRPEIWTKKYDCMFIDSDEATKEQIHFINRVKQLSNIKTSEIDTHYFGYDNPEEFYQFGINEPIRPYESEIKIPKKFEHVDINRVNRADTEVKELMAVLKSVHPWSSLHYGYAAADMVKRLYLDSIPKYYGKSCEIQILSPMTRGTLGTINLNIMIQASANPPSAAKREIRVGERIFRVGDRVIHRRNNYDLGVFNGDIGLIVDMEITDLTCLVSFYPDSRVVKYQRDDILELDLAYAITIHKSQGSEFDTVIIPILSQHFKMLFRNLIYTGLTRAKKLAIFVGTRKAMLMAVKNQDTTLRQTALEELLKDY
ncbi:MAG: AAA family ATPase [Desulfamplus sp.]|nr:AAA family ATPase [Desulfamplus sp.]